MMIKIKKTNGHVQSVISLHTQPRHRTTDSVIGSGRSKQAGTVFYGFNSMDYELPGGDCLRLIANHSKHNVQILLITNDPAKIQSMPGTRPASLVANTITQINRYLLRSSSYTQPLSKAQNEKLQIATECINQLTKLLFFERSIHEQDWDKQEMLRHEVKRLIGECSGKNSLKANQLLISDGELGVILYEALQAAQHYEFNRLHRISYVDQLDFSEIKAKSESTPYFVWDSELHISYDDQQIEDALRCICKSYDLQPAADLNDVPANRFKRVEVFFQKLWAGGVEWIDYLTLAEKPRHSKQTTVHSNGLATTTIKPYYTFEGLKQNRFSSLSALVKQFTTITPILIKASSLQEAEQSLHAAANGCWYHDEKQQLMLIRHQNEIIKLRYFYEDGYYRPLPNGQDLYTLSQLSKKHLYFFERFGLKFKAFFSHIPVFWRYFSNNLTHYFRTEIRDEFINHIEKNHHTIVRDTEMHQPIQANSEMKLLEALHEKNLANGQKLSQFVKDQFSHSHYVIAREEHPPSPIAYNNPLHRIVSVLRHFSAFFVDTSEKNPLIGTLAMAAYIYGGAAIVAPQVLTAILSKLHLHGLIKGIEPTQALGRWMSHGTTSEAISAAITYWQGMVVGGDLDQFFIQAINVLHEDPAEVAIIVSLAIGMGYGLCEAIPSLAKEMGRFPYINYAALGAKSGVAIYDTVMNPGEDWLLGSIKWFMRGGVIVAKLLVAPFIEGYRYGFKDGFVSGLKKSGALLLATFKEISAALADLTLLILTIPFLEISALFIHVPFRGLTGLISKTLGALGNWQSVGQVLIDFSRAASNWHFMSGYRLSPLYGFYWLNGQYNKNPVINFVMNCAAVLITPPWQILKNFLILPLLDTLFLSIRLSLALTMPIVQVLTYCVGQAILAISPLWDQSIGKLFTKTAKGITLFANWLDSGAGDIKQSIVGKIQVARRAVFNWAFAEKDQKTSYVNTDREYFMQKPMRIERLDPSSHFLMKAHFGNKKTANMTEVPKPKHCSSPLDSQKEPIKQMPYLEPIAGYKQ